MAAVRNPGRESILLLRHCSRIPNCGADITFLVSGLVEIINRDHLPVLALNRARVAQVPGAAVASKKDLVAPRGAIVIAHTRANSEGRRAVTVGNGQAAVSEPHQTRRIPSTGIGSR